MSKSSRKIVITAATLATLAGAFSAAIPANAATAGVSVDWKITQNWGTGYQGAVTVKNNTGAAINPWKVNFAYGNTLASVWDAQSTPVSGGYQISGPGWNQSIPAGGTASFGFVGAPKGGNLVPESCTVAGLTCEVNGSGASAPTTTPTQTPTTAPTTTPTITPAPSQSASPVQTITPAPAGSTVVAPYVDMGLWPPADMNAMAAATGVKAFTAAFVTQEASTTCSPAWGGYSEYKVGGSGDFKDRITAFQDAGGRVIVSFGGAAGSELAANCSNQAELVKAYEAVVNRYNLDRIDFDIEGAAIADSAANQRRAAAIATLQSNFAAKGKTIEVSLTVPVMPDGMDFNGVRTVKEFLNAGVRIAQVNLMAMDYGQSYTDMGTHAITAAQGTAAQLKAMPQLANFTTAQINAMIGITPMIGQNDIQNEVFSIADTTKVANWAKANGIGEVAWWEMTRDKPCVGTTALYLCTKTSENQWAFSKEFVRVLGGGSVSTPVTTPTTQPTTPVITPTPTPTQPTTPVITPTPTPTQPTTTPTVQPTAPAVASAVKVDVKVLSDWGSGRNVDIKVTNTGTSPISAWDISMPWTGTIDSLWNASYTLTGGRLAIKNSSWNGTLAPGATASIGLGASGTFTAPANCTFTTGTCSTNGSTSSTQPSITPSTQPTPVVTPTPTQSVTPSPAPTNTTPVSGGYTGDKRIVGYYTAWATYGRNYQVTDLEKQADKLTHINYAFANIQNGQCVLGDSYADTDKAFAGDTWDADAKRGNFNQLNKLKAAHPRVKTLISLGGWTWSANFSSAAASDASRKAFVGSCVAFMDKYGFDGIDIDWEYPVSGGLQPGKAEDKQNYTLLLNEFRNELDAKGAVDGKHYDLTIAAPAGPTVLTNLEIGKVAAEIDWMNLMSYDFHGGWENTTGHNAPLYQTPGDSLAKFNVDDAVRSYLASGMPSSKIVLGVGFYGRGWSNVTSSVNGGLNQAGVNAGVGTWEKGVFDYSDIKANYLPTMTRYWDDTAKVPYLYDSARGLWISYDDPQSIKVKADYIKSLNLGGAMYWEASGDRQGELLDVLNANL